MRIIDSSLTDAILEAKTSQKFRDWKSTLAVRAAAASRRPPHIEQSDLLKDEKHFTPQELAVTWGVSVQTIRELFKNEEGVLKIGPDGTRTRRRYKTLRIPESVADRVHTRLSA
jgi:hypothetical protein